MIEFGHDVTRTPNDWIWQEADDEAQLMGAAAQGLVIFTFNVRDFIKLAERHPRHSGIALAAGHYWTVSTLIAALDRMLTEITAED